MSSSSDEPRVVDAEAAVIAKHIDHINALAHDDRWDEVVEFRDTCLAAVQRGHQWWPAAAWAEFRVALDGPGRLSAAVLGSTLERYTLGPFAEIAASTHGWDELSPHLGATPAASLFAHECVTLGDDLRADHQFADLPDVFELPGALAAWEPHYGPVAYHFDRVQHDLPASVVRALSSTRMAAKSRTTASDDGTSQPRWTGEVDSVEDPETSAALTAVVAPWRDGAGWLVRCSVWEGVAQDFASLGFVEIEPTDALQWVVWLGASGGPSGRRRGLASGRSSLWWLLGEVLDVGSDQLAQADLLSQVAPGSTVRWWCGPHSIATAAQDGGWEVSLLVELRTDTLDAIWWHLEASPPAKLANPGVAPNQPEAPVA